MHFGHMHNYPKLRPKEQSRKRLSPTTVTKIAERTSNASNLTFLSISLDSDHVKTVRKHGHVTENLKLRKAKLYILQSCHAELVIIGSSPLIGCWSSTLCITLSIPVPICIGMPIMMHSLTPSILSSLPFTEALKR